MKNTLFILSIFILFSSCKGDKNTVVKLHTNPQVSEDGQLITFPDTTILKTFETEKISNHTVYDSLKAIGKVAAIILPSKSGALKNIVVFENTELSSNYTSLIQHQLNIHQIQNNIIKQKKIELERIKDLLQNGSTTGQELQTAQMELSIEESNLANEKAALIEHETTLITAGFSADLLAKASPGRAYLISDIPESLLNSIEIGQRCTIEFTALPKETFIGKVINIADAVDNNTRMIKAVVSINNPFNQLKTGMFANVSYGINTNKSITISTKSIITIQGENYAFLKKTDNSFERIPIQIGQQIADRVVVLNGLKEREEVVTKGTIQLKGLSFGY